MRLFIALVALVATAACKSDSPTEPLAGNLGGTYTLRTMNGASLPFTIVTHDTTVAIDTDVIIMTDVGGWNEEVGYRQTVGTAAPTNEKFTLSGTWTRSGNSLNLRIPAGLLYVGTATDTSLSLSDGSFTYVFVR